MISVGIELEKTIRAGGWGRGPLLLPNFSRRDFTRNGLDVQDSSLWL